MLKFFVKVIKYSIVDIQFIRFEKATFYLSYLFTLQRPIFKNHTRAVRLPIRKIQTFQSVRKKMLS
jgi:hypothetical protein